MHLLEAKPLMTDQSDDIITQSAAAVTLNSSAQEINNFYKAEVAKIRRGRNTASESGQIVATLAPST